MLTGGALALRVITQAATLTFAARYLGPVTYGQMAAATSLAVILGILPNLGAGVTVIARSKRSPLLAADIWRFAWPQHLLLGPLIAFAYVIAASTLLHVTLDRHTLIIIAVSEIVVMPLAMQISASLQAIDKVPLSQMVQWLVLLFRAVALGACLFAYGPDGPIDAYVTAQLVATAVGLCATATIAARFIPLWGSPRWPKRHEFFDGLAYCATSGVTAGSMEIDKIVALNATTAWDAGIYATMSRVVFAGTLPIVGLLMSAQPRLFANADSAGDEMQRLVRTVAVGCLLLGVAAAIGLNVCAPLLHLLVGQRFKALDQVLPIMSLAIPAMSLRLAGTNIMLTLGRPSRRIALDVAGVLLLVASLTLLGNRYGLAGLGAGLVISESGLAIAAWTIVLLELSRKRSVRTESPQ